MVKKEFQRTNMRYNSDVYIPKQKKIQSIIRCIKNYLPLCSRSLLTISSASPSSSLLLLHYANKQRYEGKGIHERERERELTG